MLNSLITELEHQLDRSLLYRDPLSGPSLDAAMKSWILKLKQIENNHYSDHDLEAARVEACLEHDAEIKELREAVADLEERIRQVKEIL